MQNKKHDRKKLIKELQAKIILSNCYNERYPQINKIEEKGTPDLFDKNLNVGVEVVLSTKQKLENEIASCKNPKTNNKKKTNDYQKSLEDGMFLISCKKKFVIATFWQDYKELLNSFKDKLINLNTKYFKCGYNAYDLYINAEKVGLDDDEIETLLNAMILAQEKEQYKFRYVYIQFLPYLYCFDLANNRCERKTLKQEFCNKLDILVRNEYNSSL